MGYKYKITVFTPTYNRAYIIDNLYHSLQHQTYKDFEWLVVDDGSTDDTEELFKRLMNEEKDFPIRYYKTINGGKARAINLALDKANGELFFTVDSDDYLTDDALEKVISWERVLPSENKYCGVAGNLGTSVDKTTNRLFKNDFYEGDLLDRYKNVDGERAIVFYTEIHRKYKYPEFQGENFITEAVAWNRMAHDGYKMRFYNDIIWIYEYREDGLTKAGNRLFLNNPCGYGLWLREKLNFCGGGLDSKLKLYYTFTCELVHRYSIHAIAKSIGTNSGTIVLCALIHKIKNVLNIN